MDQRVYERLVEMARAGALINYQKVGDLIGLDMGNPDHRNRIADVLDEINHEEHAACKPMISAVVVHKDSDLPGNGFFECGRALGHFTGPDDEMSRLAFFCAELKRVYAYWSNH